MKRPIRFRYHLYLKKLNVSLIFSVIWMLILFYCKDYREYWKWVSERNEDRYNVNQKHGQNYDSKNMMHTIRLLQSCEQIFRTGSLRVRVDNRSELLDIKSVTRHTETVITKAEDLIWTIEHYYTTLYPSGLSGHTKNTIFIGRNTEEPLQLIYSLLNFHTS